MRTRIAAIALAFLCTASMIVGVGAEAKTTPIHQDALEEYIMTEMADAHVLGMGISIVSEDRELYCAAYGAAQKTESDFVLGSLTKSITAAGIMHLKEAEELKLSDTVSDYLTGYDAVADVTIQELLNQTSGIAMDATMSDLKAEGTRGKFEYANANYNLLGLIIESVSGMTYEEYISDNLLDPLKMTSTYSISHSKELSSDVVPAYQNYFGFPVKKDYRYQDDDDWIKVPSGYMMSNVKDMGRYLQMYLNDGSKILDKESIQEMLHGDVDTSTDSSVTEDMFGGDGKYGMGWIEKEVNGTQILYHTGKVENTTTAMVLLPEKNIGITMMFNSMDFLVGQNLIEKMEEGIVSIELGDKPVDLDSNAYMQQHAIIDGVILLALILAWLPIMMMGFWSHRRRNRVFSIPGILIDVLIHIALPTVALVILPQLVPVFMMKQFVPDIFIAIMVIIGSLYLGAVIKLIAMIVYAIKGPKEETSEDDIVAEAKVADTEDSTEKKKEKVEAEEESKEEDKTEKDSDADKAVEEAAATKETEGNEVAETTDKTEATEKADNTKEAAETEETEATKETEESVEKTEEK